MSGYTARTEGQWIVLPTERPDPKAQAAWLEGVKQELPYQDEEVASAYLQMLAAALDSEQRDDVTVRLFFVPSFNLAPVMLEMFEYPADRSEDEEAVLSGLITVEKNERGPHVSDVVDLPGGRTVHRAVGAIPLPVTENETDMILCVFHSLRIGDIDVATRTSIGDSLEALAEVIPAVEAMLSTLELTP